MLFAIAAFELRQQLRSHVFWIVVAISAAMVAGAVWSPELRVGLSETGAVDTADFAIRTHLVWTLFYLFTAAAFAADAVLRDEQTGFAPIVRATPVPRRAHILGRALGAYAATAICYLSVPIALQLAAGGELAANLYGLALFGLPNLFVATALFLALATIARSLLGAMLGAVALLALYSAGSGGGEGWSLVEPFGFAAYAEATAGWPADQRAVAIPPLAGPILANRLLWTAIALITLALLLFLPRRYRQARGNTRRSIVAPEPHARTTSPPPLVEPRHDRSATIAQSAARTRLELRQILVSPVFAILLLLGLGQAGAVLWRLEPPSADPLVALAQGFQLTPTVVAFFFAGELYWAERDRRVHELIAAAPVPDAVLFLPKLLALSLALLGLALASAAAALMVPILKGAPTPEASRLLVAWILPKWFDWTLVGALALFLQALSPNKLAGWGLFVLYLIASLALERSGYTDPLYRYAEYPTYPVPEPVAGDPPSAFRLYWAGIAILLTAVATRLAGRAGHDPLRMRLRRLAQSRPAPRDRRG